MGRSHRANRDVVGGIVARRDLDRLAQGPYAGGQVVVKNLFWRCGRGIGEAEAVGVVFRAGIAAEAVGLFVEPDAAGRGDGLSCGDIADAGQGVAPFGPDRPVLVGSKAHDHASVLMRDQVGPVVAGRGRDGRRHDLEIMRFVGIRQDQKRIALMFNVVFQPGRARLDYPRSGGRIGGGDDADLVLVVHASRDRNESPGPQARNAHMIAGVAFGVDQRVGGWIGAQLVAVDLVRMVARIDADIEQRLPVGPGDRADVRDMIIQIGASGQVTKGQPMEFRPVHIRGPGHRAVIRADLRRSKLKIILCGSRGIDVQHHLNHVAVAERADKDRIFRTAIVTHAIGVWAIMARHAAVILFDAAAHLCHQQGLQVGRICHCGVVIGILGFQIGSDVGGQLVGCAHRLLPVGGPQPAVVVGKIDAVDSRLSPTKIRNCAHFK